VTPPPATAALPGPVVRPGRPTRRGVPPRPARPRRVSGPARAPVRVPAGPTPRPAARRPADPARATGLARGARLPDVLLDRLLGSRAWIAVVAFALIGIVAAQLWVVKLGAGIGRALEHAALLQRENTTLAIEDSALASGERVERLAGALGMVPVAEGALRFDVPRGALDARAAAAALARPAPAASSTTETSPAG
jgi:cell division protein FtsL